MNALTHSHAPAPKSRISALTPADVDAVAVLARSIWQATYPAIISQEQIDFMLAQRYNTSRLQDELMAPDIWWDQARVEGLLAAFASSLLTSTPGEMKLDKLYVDPQWQCLGFGGELIAHVTRRAIEHGCDTLILAVNKHNERAVNAYRKHGFAIREGVRVEIGNGFVMDDFIMAKPLTAHSPAR